MSVYKYDENTQTMREYDIAYQVQSGECPEIPNTLDLINTYEDGLKTRIDCTWLPLLKAVDGEIRIGHNTYSNTRIWTAVDEIFLEPTDVPVTVYGDFGDAEQIYIYNKARWGIITNEGRYTYSANTKRVFIRDDQATRYIGNDTTPNQTKDLYVAWAPNATAQINTVSAWSDVCKQIVTCSKNIEMWSGDNPLVESQIWYYNDDAVFNNDTDQTYRGTLVPFAKAETEWLDDYFIIEQDGQTLPWNTSSLENLIGKYVRLKNNNTVVAELPYWKDGDISIPIQRNMTDSPVVRTGSYTVGDVTQNYSVTLGPITRSIKVRMYINPTTEDGKDFNNICLWPFQLNTSITESPWNNALNAMLAIRVKPAGGSTWTNLHPYTLQELKQRSLDLTGWTDSLSYDTVYTYEFNTPGYYDIEWMYDVDLMAEACVNDRYNMRIAFMDNRWYYDYTNHYYEGKVREDLGLTDPWIISFDAGDDFVKNNTYCNEGAVIRDWDDNPRMETLSLGPLNTLPNVGIFSGEFTRSLKYLVYNGINSSTGHYDWVNVENWDDVFHSQGILFYTMPTRQYFPDWFLGCSVVPSVIYLHPDIYAMDNHGFDDSNPVTGWESWRYSDAGSPELRELPSNWRTLIPNYIGE